MAFPSLAPQVIHGASQRRGWSPLFVTGGLFPTKAGQNTKAQSRRPHLSLGIVRGRESATPPSSPPSCSKLSGQQSGCLPLCPLIEGTSQEPSVERCGDTRTLTFRASLTVFCGWLGPSPKFKSQLACVRSPSFFPCPSPSTAQPVIDVTEQKVLARRLCDQPLAQMLRI